MGNKLVIHIILLTGLGLFLLSACHSSKSVSRAPTWISLFNGNDLDGWTAKIRGFEFGENAHNTFYVEDGLLKVGYDGYEAFDRQYGHIFYKTPYARYRLKVEYRFTGQQAPEGEGWAFRNSGIMFHCLPPATMLKDQDFPISLEAQFLGGNGQDTRPTMNLCTPGTHVDIDGQQVTDHCITSTSPTFHGDQWVNAEIEVYGDSLIRHWVNGQVVMEYSRPVIGGGVVNGFDPAVKKDGEALSSGYIALQSESHPIHFRKVEIMVIDD